VERRSGSASGPIGSGGGTRHTRAGRGLGLESSRGNHDTAAFADAVDAERHALQRGVDLGEPHARGLEHGRGLRSFETDGRALGIVFVVQVGGFGRLDDRVDGRGEVPDPRRGLGASISEPSVALAHARLVPRLDDSSEDSSDASSQVRLGRDAPIGSLASRPLAAKPDPDALARALTPTCGPGLVAELRRLSGGASRESWSFDLVAGSGARQGFVLRRDPGEFGGESDRSTEYRLLEAAAANGVVVPRVRMLLRPEDDLGRGFVMDRVEGETIPRKILRDDAYADARPRLAAQCGEIAARIHAIDPATLPPLPEQGAAWQVEQYRALLDTFGEPHPAFELGLRWLEARVPPAPSRPELVHGDFRNGNFIVGPHGIVAVLDWELAHLGDCVEDLGWLCVKSWRFGVTDNLVGGFGAVPDLLDAYQRAGGRAVDEDALRFWIALGTLKWGVICVGQAFTHLNGLVRSVELATLGRRVAETEWDLLGILDGGW
jgi:aminoglycoside phosphotransferase (APT) family kinase protein